MWDNQERFGNIPYNILMAITPSPGYQIDPNNPNAVIKDPNASVGYNWGATTPQQTPVPQVQAPPASAPVQMNVGTPQSTASITPQPKQNINQYQVQPGESITQYNARIAASNPNLPAPGTTSPTGVSNKELAQKYTDAYNAQKTQPVPQNKADAMSSMNQHFEENKPSEDSQKILFDTYAEMPPYVKTMYDQINQVLSTPVKTQSFAEEYQKLTAEQGLPALNTELMNLTNVMEGTEDDIRNEITKAGGFSTESQVQALTGARNKTLMRTANQLQQQIALKRDYVNQIMQFSQLDRAQVEKDVDRKLGLTEKMAKIQEQMTTAAKGNYQKVVDKVGYSGLATALGDDSHAQKVAERALGLPIGSLSDQDFLSTERKTEWSEPYKLGGDIVQKNIKTGEIKTAVNVSAGAGGIGGGKLLSVEEAMKLGVPYGTTQAQAFGLAPKKPLGETQTTDLTQAQIARNNVKRISALIDSLGEQGPVIGRFRQANPYDTRVVELQNLITQTVPGLARGVFKEVGVLTDQDVERYTKTLANPKLTKEQAKIATDQLLETVNYSINTQLSTLDKAGRDVRDFDDLRAVTSTAKPKKLAPGTIITKGNKTYKVADDGESLTEQTGTIDFSKIKLKK